MIIELGYFTLKVADIARARAFYGALFGWEFEGNGHVGNTKFPLGISGGGPVDVSFAFFRVADLEDAIARLTTLGGQVRRRRNPPSGANAECSDDQGTIFSLWQPAPGFE